MPPIVSEQEWRAAREALLVKEKAATRALDALAGERRQLVVYQFMDNGPDDYCPGCSGVVDNVGHLAHLHARDTTFVVVSDMPLTQITPYWQRMGWTVPVYSSRGNTFSADCGAGSGFGTAPSSATATPCTAPTSPAAAVSTGSGSTSTFSI